ncbi:MAG: hypothetical protein QHH10_10695 [Peptococcaceae bacterium]|jgi:hypothetical protein|nr:hypothetical protein [Peptococcaceae bacterium]MDH7525766.1 hypothetical protein [Peptococcaceae bacterium]
MQIRIERLGIPTVAIITTPFRRDAKAAAEIYKMPRVRMVALPHPIADVDEKTIPAKLEAAYEDIVRGLTSPLTPEEQETGVIKATPRPRVVMEGTLWQVHKSFVDMAMSDGLPVIPPTEDRVKEMLKGTSHSPDEIIGRMDPEKWEVTVEKVAINGVMAGCLPEYMPVLLAAAEAMTEPSLDTESDAGSTNSFAYWGFINGPYAGEIGMNCGINALGTGNCANATIGRAIRLFLINLGGSNPSNRNVSSQGNPLKYGFSFSENEAESPWQPFHVDKGYKPEESTITLFKTWGFRSTPLSGKGLGLDNMVWTARNMDSAIGFNPWRGLVILLDPLLAKQIAEQGMSKKDVQEFMWLSLQRSIEEWRNSFIYTVDVRHNLYPRWYQYLAPEVMIPKYNRPEAISIVVVGGQTNPYFMIFDAASPMLGVTKSIDKWR